MKKRGRPRKLNLEDIGPQIQALLQENADLQDRLQRAHDSVRELLKVLNPKDVTPKNDE